MICVQVEVELAVIVVELAFEGLYRLYVYIISKLQAQYGTTIYTQLFSKHTVLPR